MTDIALGGRRLGDGSPPYLEFPTPALPMIPAAAAIWSRALSLAWLMLIGYSLHLLSGVLMDYWYFESLGFQSVFWTNFQMGALLFVATLAAVSIAITLPARVHGLSGHARTRILGLGVLTGTLAGYWAASKFAKFLPAFSHQSFGQTDPVFGHDISFYAFVLPAVESFLTGVVLVAALALVASIATASAAPREGKRPRSMPKFYYVLGLVSTSYTRVSLFVLFVLLAARTWFGRYGVLVAENEDSAIFNGAEYIDVTGFFSTVNGYTVTALALFFASALCLRLGVFHRAAVNSDYRLAARLGAWTLILALLPGVTVDLSFKAMVALRDQTRATPNEPVIQLPYMQQHIDATNEGFGLNNLELVSFEPNGEDDPLPDIDRILSSPTIQNAPLWPGYVSHLEEVLDIQHTERILQTQGDTVIYGPTLDIFKQQEQLRPYYDFLSIDTVRYTIDGEKRIFANATRELPVDEIIGPWLLWWGQRQLLYTHGHGLVTAHVSEQTPVGGAVLVSGGIPTEAQFAELAVDNPSIYYGEGSIEIAFSNVEGVEELDFATEQGRATVDFPRDVTAGVRLDSILKRLVFGWRGHLTLDVLFSDLLASDSRVHFYRPPLDRVERLAPFAYFDTNPYAVAADGGIEWMVNGMTYTDRYPNSWIQDLGDKADVRTPTPRDTVRANYVRDSIKATVNAYTGEVTFYKWADEPVLNTWQGIYPDLFTDSSRMSEDTRSHVYYPVQLFHTQMDDVNPFYHMRDAIEYFNREDLWDDADEVKGGLIDEGEAISFSVEPYYWMVEPGGALPDSSEDTQFSMSMLFTPEAAVNLRSIATVYMDGEDYGRISVLQIPKGHFFPGPEQADAAIDQDALISSQITLWNRLGTEVIRGHTVGLIVDNELIYIEPMFIKSKQNPAPQMKRVVVVFRGQAFMGTNLENALRAAILGEPEAVLEGAGGEIQPVGLPAIPGVQETQE